MLTPTNNNVINHLYESVFLVDTNVIHPLCDHGLKYYRSLKSSTYKGLEKLRKENKITIPIWHSFTNFQM